MSLRRIFVSLATAVTGVAATAVVAAPAASCHVNLRAGVDSVRVHTYASTSAPMLGVLYPGQTLQSAGFDGTVGSYNDCGGASNRWITIYGT